MTKEAPKRRKNGTFASGHSGNKSGVRKDALVTPDPIDREIIPGLTFRHFDGWVSRQTGIGQVGQDKRLTHTFQAPLLTYTEAIDLWSKDDIARRAIQGPVEECFRQGYEITISDEGRFDDLKEAVEDKLTELKVNHYLERALCMERAVGGAAILVGANDHLPLDQPLDVNKVTSIDWLTLLEPLELQPDSYYDNPAQPKYNEPEFYRLNTYATSGTLAGVANSVSGERAAPPNTARIHESRLLVFGGVKVSKFQITNNVSGALWGESKLTSMVEVLRDFNVAYHAAGLIATDISQPVISIENLMTLVVSNPADLQARMRAFEQGRSTARAILIDGKKEKFERQNTNIAGIPELLNALSMRLAAAVDMPLTLLLGQPTQGIGNEGTPDVRFYYDRIKGRQTNQVGPHLRYFVKMIMSTIRKRKLPKKWSITFHELWQMTDAEKAQARLTQGRLDSMMIKSGVLYPNEVRMSRYRGGFSWGTQIDERKKAPGFLTPPPNGTPGSAHNPGLGGPGAIAGPASLNAHPVGGYTRKNPVSKGTEPATPEGGDQTPGNGPNSKKDADGPGDLVAFAGFPVIIESPKGSYRQWTDNDGTTGQTLMKYDYGYIDGAIGADGDCVDVYLGPDETAKWVYVIHQNKRPDFMTYDEDKCLLGFPSANAAQEAYLAQYNDERFFGGMSQMPIETFRQKIFQEAGKVSNA